MPAVVFVMGDINENGNSYNPFFFKFSPIETNISAELPM